MSPRHSAQLSMEYVLLALIDQKPMHGYELYQELCALPGISQVWNIKQALLYALLEKLEHLDFVVSRLEQGDSYPPRKVFDLTAAGRISLQSWLRTPVRRARELRQEFLAKLILARRYGRETALELLHRQQQACQGWLAELKASPPCCDPEHANEWIVYSFRVSREESTLAWLRQCEREVFEDLPPA